MKLGRSFSVFSLILVFVLADDNEESCGGDINARKVFCSPCSRATCTSINDEQIACAAVCDGVAGCDCKSGYVLHDGICIPINDCPSCTGKNEVFSCRKCDLIFNRIDPQCTKTESCKDDCYCKLGYARDASGECIRLDKISQSSCANDPNAYFDQCGLICEQKTCQNKDVILNNNDFCILFKDFCSASGKCICKKGYIKNSVGKCVVSENC